MFSVCLCFGSWILCIYVERCFESLICQLDLCLSSLFVAFISLCFSSLWKTCFYQARQLLDRFTFNEPLFLLLSTEVNDFDLSRYLEFFSIASRSIEKLSFWLIDPQQILIEVGFCSIASRQFLDLSKALLYVLFFTCFTSFYYLVIHSILFHYIHAFIWIPCVPLIILDHLYVSQVKFSSFLYPLSIMIKRGRHCGDFVVFFRFYMLGEKYIDRKSVV